MSKVIDEWLLERAEKLEKRIAHHRSLGRSLMPDSALNIMNERALLQMEGKLFQLKRQLPKQPFHSPI